jgi:hypothetical protein
VGQQDPDVTQIQRWRWAVPPAIVGVFALTVILVNPGGFAHLAWFAPALDVAIFVLMAVVAAIGVTDCWVRSDRRFLPLAAASFSIGVLWLGGVATSTHTQTTAALSVLAYVATPTVLLAALLLSRPRRLTRPWWPVGVSVGLAVVAPAFLIAAAAVAAPHLPRVAGPSGMLTGFGHAVSASSVVPALAGLVLCMRGDRNDERLAGPLTGALVLLVAEGLGTLGAHSRSSVGWYALAALRIGAFVLILFGELRLYAISAQAERRRALDMEGVHSATQLIGASLNPAEVARQLAATAQKVVIDRVRGARGVSVRVFRVDGPVVSVIARVAPVGGRGRPDGVAGRVRPGRRRAGGPDRYRGG